MTHLIMLLIPIIIIIFLFITNLYSQLKDLQHSLDLNMNDICHKQKQEFMSLNDRIGKRADELIDLKYQLLDFQREFKELKTTKATNG